MVRFPSVFLALLLGAALSACAASMRTPSAAQIQAAISQTQSAIQAKPPRATPSAIPSAAPTPEILPETGASAPGFIATLIADPGPAFSRARVYGMAHLSGGRILITLEVPGNLSGEFHADLGGDELRCLILEEFPNRLYCHGPSSHAGQVVSFELFEAGQPEPVFRSEIGILPSPPSQAEKDDHARRDDED